jgi:DNA-binding CsgD family transcriptional regulator
MCRFWALRCIKVLIIVLPKKRAGLMVPMHRSGQDASLPANRLVVSPRLIGRATQIAVLRRALAAARGGTGQCIAIAGEAGIGKSRLVAEAAASAADDGFTLVQGRCFESDRAFPYAPLLDLLRAYLSAHPVDELSNERRAAVVELAGLLPELGLHSTNMSPPEMTDPEHEQRQLFQTLLLFFTRLPMPLLIVVEDLHWSDEGSLAFLLYVIHRITSFPVCLLLTYRNDEISPVLAVALATLQRERIAADLTLSRLPKDEVALLIGSIFDLPRVVRTEFLETLHTLTEGNPFFIEETLKALVMAGDIFYANGTWDRRPINELRIPHSLQLAVQQRLDRLSPAAREVITIAAVAGRRFDFDLLRELTGHGEQVLVSLMKELIKAQLVVEESADSFAFRHALTRQAVESDLLARERRALHKTIAEALERASVAPIDSHLADLAAHFDAAEVWDRVLEYAQRAGEWAQARYAPRAAIEQFSRAINAAQHLSVAPDPRMYRARGQMYELLSDYDAAHADYQRVLDAVLEDRARIQALLDLGWLWIGRDYQRASSYLQHALRLARADGDPAALAATLNRLGNWHANNDQPHEARQYHQEALALFEQIDERRGLAATLDLLGTSNLITGDVRAAAGYYERAITLFRKLDERQGLVTALAMSSMRGASYVFDTVICPAADPEACDRDANEAIAIARRIGWRAGEAGALIYIGLGCGARGLYARALDAGHTSLRIATEIEHHQWVLAARWVLGAIYLDLQNLPEARRHLEPAVAEARAIGHTFSVHVASSFLATTLIRQGSLTQAEALLALTRGADPPRTMPDGLLRRAHAELALAQAAPAKALRIVDDLITRAGSGGDRLVIPGLWQLRGAALAALGRGDEAAATLQAAYDTGQAQGVRPICWRVRLAHGKLLLTRGHRDQAGVALDDARAIVAELAAGISDTQVRETFLRDALALFPRRAVPSPRSAAKRSYDGLTERERDVAALITQGKTNRQIAEALVLSERTVQVHITNMLGKLGFSSRAQIAAWSVEKGLARERDA